MNLKNKSFLKLLDLSTQQIEELLALSAELKAKKKAGIPHKLCEGKNVVLLFAKDSTRTRCAFEVAASDLGMGCTYLGPTGSHRALYCIHSIRRRNRRYYGPYARC